MSDTWPLQDAKNRFSELVDRAITQGPQVVTRHGRRVVVVLPYEEYQRITQPKDSLLDFLLHSPLAGSGLPIERDAGPARDLDFEP